MLQMGVVVTVVVTELLSDFAWRCMIHASFLQGGMHDYKRRRCIAMGLKEVWKPVVPVQIEKLRIFRSVSESHSEKTKRLREALVAAVLLSQLHLRTTV